MCYLGTIVQVASLGYCRVSLGFISPFSYTLKTQSSVTNEDTSTGEPFDEPGLAPANKINTQSFAYSKQKPTSAEEEEQWI